MHQLIFSASNLVDRAGIEPATFRVSDGCTASRALGRRSPAPESNWLLRFTGAAHRHQCLRGTNLEPAERIERPSEAYRASALPLSYTGWSRRADSNRHLSFTKALFFPLNYFDLTSKYLERVTGFEPVSGPWQGPILATRRYPRGASGENRTLLASLEDWNSTNKSHSLELQSLTIHLSKSTLPRQRGDS